MSLKEWEKHGWLKAHKTSAKEIADLFAMVERDLAAARTKGLDSDWRFGIAYNAALKLCTILLYSEGYEAEKKGNTHYRTIDSLGEILGQKYRSQAEYLNSCRALRNTIEYDHVGGATDDDADELIDQAEELRTKVKEFLKAKHLKFL